MTEADFKLPAIHCECGPRIVRTLDELKTLRYVNAVTNLQRQYFVDAQGEWFEGRVTVIYARSGWIQRLIGNDFIRVGYEFVRLAEPPMNRAKFYRFCTDTIGSKRADAKHQQKLFRELTTVPEIVDWLDLNGAAMQPFVSPA